MSAILLGDVVWVVFVFLGWGEPSGDGSVSCEDCWVWAVLRLVDPDEMESECVRPLLRVRAYA